MSGCFLVFMNANACKFYVYFIILVFKELQAHNYHKYFGTWRSESKNQTIIQISHQGH
jgi:hypothetical protein